MNELTGIFKMIEEHSYTNDKCFLCGFLLNYYNKTVEHVIPKWLQKRFNLWDQHIVLLNRTKISYRCLTIPCCLDCNNIYLKPFEDEVCKAFNNGFDAFKNINKEILFLWLGKIYFGIMYRELFLLFDRKSPYKGNILDPEYVKSFYSHFLFLQGIRKCHKFRDFFPASIYFFKTQVSNSIDGQWNFIDNHYKPFIAIRMGEIGVISVLQDGGATQQLEKHLEKHKKIDLHPIQFREISAKILYKAILLNRTPKYINIQIDDHVETFMLPLQGFSDKLIFDDWDNEIYASLLSQITQVQLEIFQPEKGKYRTWLQNENGESIFIDVNE